MTDPTCPHAAHNARIAELEAEVEAARAEQARLNTAWRVEWQSAIDTYSSLLHKEQDLTERLKEELAQAWSDATKFREALDEALWLCSVPEHAWDDEHDKRRDRIAAMLQEPAL